VHPNTIQILRSLREQKGFKQADLSSMLGHSHTWYSKVEQGKNQLLLSDAIKLAKIYGVSVEEIFFHEVEELLVAN
jgi:transcriptional regulator with XRE-family HTH domain